MRAIAEQATDYWHLMIDFFELLHGGNMEDLPVDTTMVTEEAHRVEILGKQYTSGSWVRFGTQISPSLKGAQIHSMYTIDQACYLVLDVYPESEERVRARVVCASGVPPFVASLLLRTCCI